MLQIGAKNLSPSAPAQNLLHRTGAIVVQASRLLFLHGGSDSPVRHVRRGVADAARTGWRQSLILTPNHDLDDDAPSCPPSSSSAPSIPKAPNTTTSSTRSKHKGAPLSR